MSIDVTGTDEGGKGTAPELWERDPVKTFEILRDRICEAIRIVCEIHQQALAAPQGVILVNVGTPFHNPLHCAVVEAQAIWFCTPIARYLDRPEGPVSSNCEGQQSAWAGTGSCYHDLALGAAVYTLRCIRSGARADDFTRITRFRTGAGDHVTQHLTSLARHVRSECQRGVARWQEAKWKQSEGGCARTLEPDQGADAAHDQNGAGQAQEADREKTEGTPTVEPEPPEAEKPKPPQVPSLDDEDIAILKVLQENSPRRCTTYDIEANSRVTRKTIGQRLRLLIKQNLVSRPNGPKRGATITLESLAHLKKCPAPK